MSDVKKPEVEAVPEGGEEVSENPGPTPDVLPASAPLPAGIKAAPSWAEVMAGMYATSADIINFLRTKPEYGTFQNTYDMRFVVGEFQSPNMTRPEKCGLLLVLGEEMIEQVKAILSGAKPGLDAPGRPN